MDCPRISLNSVESHRKDSIESIESRGPFESPKCDNLQEEKRIPRNLKEIPIVHSKFANVNINDLKYNDVPLLLEEYQNLLKKLNL